MSNSSALMFTCSLIEFIGRQQHLERLQVVKGLGTDALKRIYRHADVLHSEPIASVADTYVELASLQTGSFDNVAACRYLVPDYWTIGAVYARLIEDVGTGENPIDDLEHVYESWVSDAISNYNSDFYYQPRDYIKECYLAGKVL